MDYVLVFLCPGCGLMFIAGRYVGRIACSPVCGVWLLCVWLGRALYVGFLYQADALFLFI